MRTAEAFWTRLTRGLVQPLFPLHLQRREFASSPCTALRGLVARWCSSPLLSRESCLAFVRFTRWACSLSTEGCSTFQSHAQWLRALLATRLCTPEQRHSACASSHESCCLARS